MKTCLYCGANNADSAKICVLCGRNLKTGDRVSRGSDSNDNARKRLSIRMAIPRPESSYANLLLLVPILVLFLMGMAFGLAPSVDHFYDLQLPLAEDSSIVGVCLILVAIAMTLWMIIRISRSIRVHKGYQLMLRDESNEDNALINLFCRYHKRTIGWACLLWLIPIVFFFMFIVIMFMSSFAYSVSIVGMQMELPEVDDPLPYVLLLLIGLIFLIIRFVVTLRVTMAYRHYEKNLLNGDVIGMEDVRTGMAAALDVRAYPQPLPPYIYLLLIPSVIVLVSFGIMIFVAPIANILGMNFPLFAHPAGASVLFILAAIVIACAMIRCYKKQKAVTRGYFEALRMDENTPFSADLEQYAHYQKQACDYNCFLWLLPVVLFLSIIQLFYVSSYAKYAIFLNQYKLLLPTVTEPMLYVLLSMVAIIFLVILFFVTLNNTRSYRRCDAANRKRHHEEMLRAEAERAAAEKAAEEEAAKAAEEAAQTPAAPAAAHIESDDLGIFWDAGAPVETVAQKPVESEEDRLDPLERLRGIDTYESAPVTTQRSVGNLRQLCDEFVRFAKSHGYMPELSSVRALMAALATSRVVFIRTCDDASATFAKILPQFFGSNAPVMEVTSAWNSVEPLLFNTTLASKRASDGLCGLYRANYVGDIVSMLTLTHVERGSSKDYLKDMLAYSESHEHKCRMQVLNARLSDEKLCAKVEADDDGVYLPLSQNIWCLAVSDDAKNFYVPSEGYTTGAALTVSLRGKSCDATNDGALASSGLCASDFARLTRDITDRHFLPEEQWKKFDRVESFLQKRAGIRFDNRLMCRLETFSSAYLAMNDDANQILDAMLEAFFLPMISRLDPGLLDSIEGGAGIRETVALSFGADNVPSCMQMLQELGFEA